MIEQSDSDFQQRFTVEGRHAGERLDKVLSEILTGISRSKVQKMIDADHVRCNGKSVVKKQQLLEGDIIEVASFGILTASQYSTPEPQDIPLEILFEDDDLLAVNKPAGLVVHPGHGVPDGTLVNALLHKVRSLSGGSSGERPGIVHRLDKETSGVVLVAKNDIAHARLSAAFAARDIQKEYVAFCIGRPSHNEGTIDLPLERSRREPLKRAVMPKGKCASTTYKLQGYRNGISLIRFFPHTGRTHQIRVHSSASGFPILADTLYGGDKSRILRIAPAERPFAYKLYKFFSRHALHAYKITFPHPSSREPLTVSAPFPEDCANGLRLFGENAGLL